MDGRCRWLVTCGSPTDRAAPLARPDRPEPAVEMLRPSGGAVAKTELDGAERLQVLEVAARSAAADAGALRNVRRRHLAGRLACGVDDEAKRWAGDTFGQPLRPVDPKEGKEMVDVALAGLAQPPHSLRQRGVPLEPLPEGLEDERLDEVVDDAALHRGPQRLHVLRSRDGDHVDGFVGLPKPPDHLEAAHVGQVDVEQEQVGPQAVDGAQGLGPCVPLPNRLEPRHPLDVGTVDRGRHEVVVDDEGADHDGAPLRAGSWGRNAVKRAPPSFSTSTQPPSRRRTVWLTSASPSPRRPVPVATFVVKPSRKISSTSHGPTPGPESCTCTRTPSGSSRMVTATVPPPTADTESSALSTRLPTTVTRSRASA